MARENPSSQKQTSASAQPSGTTKSSGESLGSFATTPAPSRKNKKGSAKKNRPQIGGTAVAGAKSTQPKPAAPASNNPNEQQIESYNRTMRRRMEHLGAGPYSEKQGAETLQDRRKKRIERRKERLEERREELRKSLPGGKIGLGRRNTYFLIAVAAAIVLLIVVFVVLRALHIL